MAHVELTDLETIRRFSIATRGATAPLEEVVAALRADLDASTQDSPHDAEVSTKAAATASDRRTPARASRQRAAENKASSGRSGGRQRSRVS
ncbi:MAG: hypothetical protein M3133_10840 [Actinomycetota bacterium]|nr:hypothetical protein [Actinomycetota bacterium]